MSQKPLAESRDKLRPKAPTATSKNFIDDTGGTRDSTKIDQVPRFQSATPTAAQPPRIRLAHPPRQPDSSKKKLMNRGAAGALNTVENLEITKDSS